MDTYFNINDCGTISFLGDANEVAQIRVALSKQNVRILKETDALFMDRGVADTDFEVEGSEEDISFALGDMIKHILPYRKAKI